jgi:hypothetical protein
MLDTRYFNILVIEDQPNSINSFIRRFENHVLVHSSYFHLEARYQFLRVELEPEDQNHWRISDSTLNKLANIYNDTELHLILIDYAFVPVERDEELTYKLQHHEIANKEELLGIYVIDAYALYENLFEKYPEIEFKASNSKIHYILYTYPADSLMHLLGDAQQRRNKLSKILRTPIDVLDTRQLLYGGDKNLEKYHNRSLYPQLLGGHLNNLILLYMQKKVLEESSMQNNTPSQDSFSSSALTPLGLLTQAIQAVPAVKWALGVGGIVSVLAIIGAMVSDYKVAGFGALIIIILMGVLVLFSRWTAIAKKELVVQLKIFTWFILISLILSSTFTLSSIFFQWPIAFKIVP